MTSIVPTPPPVSVSPSHPSRRTIIGAAAWGVPALSIASATPAFANTSDQPQVRLAVADGRVPATGTVTVTATVLSAQGQPAAGQSVSLTGPAGAVFGDAVGTTAGDGTFATTFDLNRPGAKPGSSVTLTAVSGNASTSTAATVLSSNALSCGRNANGEAGNGIGGASDPTRDTLLTMTQLQRIFPSPIVDMQGGATGFTLALLADHTVWGVGSDFHGSLGGIVAVGAATQTWKQIGGLPDIAQIAVGSANSYAIDTTGGLWAWGFNQNGRVGNGTTVDVSSPVKILPSGAAQVASGDGTVYVAMTDGSVRAWGQGSGGAVGDGGTSDVLSPVEILPASAGVTQVAGQYNGGYALANGQVYSWGRGELGQRGDGTTNGSTQPALIPNFNGVAQVSAGGDGAYALKTDKTVWAWGRNDLGQIGDGTTTNRLTPVQVTAVSNVVQLAATGRDAAVLTSAGKVWAWGENAYGVLSDGTATPRESPVQMTGLSGVAVSRVAPQYGGGGTSRFATITADSAVTTTMPATVVAGAPTSVTATVNAGSTPIAGATVTLSGTGASAFGQASGTTDASGVFQTTVQVGTGTRPGRTLQVTAVTDASSSTASATVLGANAMSCGVNPNGAVGTGSTTPSAIAQMTQLQCAFPSPVIDVQSFATGGTLALLQDGTVWAVGGDFHGTLGGAVPVNTATSSWTKISTLSNVTQIAVGSATAFAIKTDGSLWAWGFNQNGRVGNGSTTDVSTPVQVISANARQVASGDGTAYVVMTDGSVRAWGQGARGAVGNGGTADVLSPVEVLPASAGVTQVAGQYNGGYAVASGQLYSWGRNEFGQLANGSTTDTSTPAVIPNFSNVAQVTASGDGAYALKTDKTVWGWGRNNGNGEGMVGDGTNIHRSTPVQINVTNVVQLSGVGGAGAVLTSTGQVWAWGANSNGRLGDGSKTDRLSPVQMIGLGGVTVSRISQVYGGGGTANFALITADNSVSVAIGSAAQGGTATVVAGTATAVQARVAAGSAGVAGVGVALSGTAGAAFAQSSGSTDSSGTFATTVQIDAASKPGRILQVTATTDQAAATTTAVVLGSNALSCGRNSNGEAGIGVGGVSDSSKDPVLTMTPLQRAFPSPVIDVQGAATGMTLALLEDQTVWAVGGDFHGDMAGAAPVNSYTETWKRITSLSGVTQVNVGSGNGYALLSDGSLWGWGVNDRGQLGNGTTIDSAAPVRIISGGVAQVASGDCTVFAAMKDGSVRAWGYGSRGAVGNGSLSNQLTPVEILPASAQVTQVAAQYNGGYALNSSGQVYSWGRGELGQRGDGTTNDSSAPALIPNFSGVAQLSAGGDNGYAFKTDKTVWAWGRNDLGQIGDGTSTIRLTPVQVTAVSNVVQLAVIGRDAAVLTANGQVWAWGENGYGVLGDGTTTTRTTPVQMTGLSNVAIARITPRFGGGGTTRFGLIEK